MELINDWEGGDIATVLADFEADSTSLDACTLLIGSYSYESYEGSAFVLFEKDGKLFEVNGGHCSCYGLEGQWDPEETTIASLRKRFEKETRWSDPGLSAAVNEVLDTLERQP